MISERNRVARNAPSDQYSDHCFFSVMEHKATKQKTTSMLTSELSMCVITSVSPGQVEDTLSREKRTTYFQILGNRQQITSRSRERSEGRPELASRSSCVDLPVP